MATVLCAWELGGGSGHVQPLLHVARALADARHRPVFALANVVDSAPLLEAESFPILQAPLCPRGFMNLWRPGLASSYADILVRCGWGTVETLSSLTAAWQALLDLVSPQIVICEYAPTAALAAFGQIPTLHVGSWFFVPPVDQATFPVLVAGQTPLLAQEELLAIVQAVQRRRNRPIPAQLTSIFQAENCFPAVFPEVDAYRSRRTQPSFDPLELLLPPLGAPENEFFAYLSAEHPFVESDLREMAITGMAGTAYVRGASSEMKQRLRGLGLQVLDKPASLQTQLADAAVVVHHGGLGTGSTALTAGRPQLIVPPYVEQNINALQLERLGVSLTWIAKEPPQAAAQKLHQLMTYSKFAEGAQALAHDIHKRPRRPALPAILQRCQHYLPA